jgi:hypothetical protein
MSRREGEVDLGTTRPVRKYSMAEGVKLFPLSFSDCKFKTRPILRP